MTVLIWMPEGKGLGRFRVVSRLYQALKKFGCGVVVSSTQRDELNFFGVPAPLGGIEAYDALVFEMWPILGAQLRMETTALIKEFHRQKPNGKVYSLLRDVAGSACLDLSLVERFVDTILVRGDGQIGITETWPLKAGLLDRVRHVGYFGPDSLPRTVTPDWVFSAGGSWFERANLIGPLVQGLHAVHSPLRSSLRLFTSEITVRPSEEYLSRLAASGFSVLQAGYNSVMEALCFGVPAIFFPAARFVRSEQIYRMRRFTELGIVAGCWQYVEFPELPGRLEAAYQKASTLAPPEKRLRFGGETEAARIIVGGHQCQ